MKEHYYYSLDKSKIYVSNSLLNSLDTDIDGSPNKCKQFIDGTIDRKETPSLENGSIIHKYSEDKESFVLEAIKPPEQTEYLTRYIFENYVKSGTKIEGFIVLDAISKIRENQNLYGNTKDELKLLEKFNNDGGWTYLEHLKDSQGKIAITPAQEVIITNVTRSLEYNPTISRYLFAEDTDATKTYKEIAIIFKAPVPIKKEFNSENSSPLILDFKVLIDNLTIDYKHRAIVNTDLKTTGKSIYKYHSDENRVGSFEYWKTYRQLGIYERAIDLLINGKAKAIDKNGMNVNFIFPEPEKWKIYSQIAAVETHGYYKSVLFPIGKGWIKRGQDEARELMQQLAWHIQNNIWDQTIEEFYFSGKISKLQTSYIR